MRQEKIIKMAILIMACHALTAMPAIAQTAPSQVSVQYAERVAGSCPGKWEDQACLRAVSESALVLAANYAADLHKKKHADAVEKVKEHCAAATAATQGEYPAYAMKSAFTECSNTIFDAASETGVEPDLSHYQLLIGAVLCLQGDRRCASVEQGLRKYKS